MMAYLSIPTLLSSIFFMSGGLYTFVLKRTVLPLVIYAAASAFHGVSFYLILAKHDAFIGFCMAATASLCALAIGSCKLFFCKNENSKDRNIATSIFSVGLACASFYHGVLFTKMALRSSLVV